MRIVAIVLLVFSGLGHSSSAVRAMMDGDIHGAFAWGLLALTTWFYAFLVSCVFKLLGEKYL